MQDKIQELTNSLLRLSSSFTLSDAIDSDADVDDGTAATPLAVKTAYDKAVEAKNSIVSPFNSSGQLVFPNGSTMWIA